MIEKRYVDRLILGDGTEEPFGKAASSTLEDKMELEMVWIKPNMHKSTRPNCVPIQDAHPNVLTLDLSE